MTRNRIMMLAAFLTSAISPTPAIACRLRPPTQAELEQRSRSAFAQAEIIAEVEGVTDPGGTSGGSVRVLRVFKGSLIVGSIMEFTGPTEVIVTCNSPPPLATNSRGIVFLRQGSTEFPGFLNPRMEAFVRQNLLGID